jgi:hypothetical protein
MNNTFSLKRFALLFKKHTMENAKTYLLSIAVIVGLLFLLFGFMMFTSHNYLPVNAQGIIFTFALWIIGSIFTSLSFADLGDKKKAIGVLTLPASHLEKFLVRWLYSFVIFPLIFTGVFYLVDWTMITIRLPPPPDKNELFSMLDPTAIQYYAFLAYAMFNAFTLWGAIFFEKLHFIKTTVVFFIYVIAFIVITDPLLHLVTGIHNSTSIPFGMMHAKTITYPNDWWRVTPTEQMKNTNVAVFIITLIVLWMSALARLKEKEV